ncbi:hypothetical protein INN71_02780 [Nocardioides sp. ChNu-153]|uniref:hypothetical protein n=1 Tax=Nocardioides sp. ChNu-153 TaxID=2779364 RepID=UPI00265279AA|nr:hypothetical protein [Nocardioides sp. ChNu-153]MDN7120311.1 hypothetical protein [Nocardioides sp. ChNu-153]
MFPWWYSYPEHTTDASWAIDVLARQIGFYSTPAPVASCVGSVPMNGGIWQEVSPASPLIMDVESGWGWGGVRGALGPVGAHRLYGSLGIRGYYYRSGVYFPAPTRRLMDDIPQFHTLDVVGTELIEVGIGAVGQAHVEIRADDGVLAVRGGTSRPWVTVPYTPGLDATYPHRVQVEMRRGGTPDEPGGNVGTFGPVRARIRSAHDAPWSEWAIDPWVGLSQGLEDVRISGGDGSSFCGWQITTDTDPALWAPPTADIVKLGGNVQAPYLPATTDPWSGIQEFAASWLAAAWQDRHGVLKVRDRAYLAGGAPASAVVTIDVGQRVEDLQWTLDPADEADRLTVTYSPVDPVVPTNDPETGHRVAPILWEASEALELAPGERREIYADVDELGLDLGGVYQQAVGTPWVQLYDTASDDAVYSTWAASPVRSGAEPSPGPGALAIYATRVSAGRFKILVFNQTPLVLYTVDGEGRPHLKLRGEVRFDQDQTATVERGAGEYDAAQPLPVDLGRHVQRPEDAAAVADFLWARAQQPGYRLNSVRIVPDWSRDIGDVVMLRHPRSDLAQKALVTKDARRGQAGQVEQHLDLVVLPWTWADFAAQSEQTDRTWGDFADEWAGRTWGDFADRPIETGA